MKIQTIIKNEKELNEWLEDENSGSVFFAADIAGYIHGELAKIKIKPSELDNEELNIVDDPFEENFKKRKAFLARIVCQANSGRWQEISPDVRGHPAGTLLSLINIVNNSMMWGDERHFLREEMRKAGELMIEKGLMPADHQNWRDKLRDKLSN